jgi:hypothetical protein
MSHRFIFTYHQSLPDMDVVSERILISLWRAAWTKAGLTPVVLSEYWAAKHPIYHEFDLAVSKLPSINPAGYDRACFLRWLAVQVAAREYLESPLDRIVLMDYDVWGYSDFLSDYFWRTVCPADREIPPRDKMFSLHGNCPALVIGTPDQFAEICHSFITYDPGDKTHVSDQYCFEEYITKQPKKFKVSMDVVLYGEPGWEKASAVHYSNSVCGPAGKTPKYLHIPTLR